ncbi:MAG: hypothetical protein HFI67_11770 [Lachnospiraceae bacterium]|nr:hypothetical protein [Lachnospiraceae bacterium]
MGRGFLKDPYERANQELFSEIARGMRLKGKKDHEIGKYAGFCESAWYKRRTHPEYFTLPQLRAIFKHLGTSNEVILKIFGREVKE